VDNLKPLALIISATAIVITTIIAAAYTTANYGQNEVKKQEYEIALEMVKQCGDRAWISWFEYAPIEGRRISCMERKAKKRRR